MKTKTFVSLIALLSLLSGIVTAAPLGTAFTYQGKLSDGTNAANGLYDLRLVIYDDATSGNVVAGPLTNAAVGVTNGLFTAVLDFGTAVFTGDARWLEIAVRTNAGAAFTPLTPRQPLTPAPYALFAPSAGAAARTPAAGLTGTIADAQLSTNVARLNGSETFTGAVQFTSPSNSFTGNGAGLTNVDLQSLNSHGAINSEFACQYFDSVVVGQQPRALIAASLFGSGTQLVTADFGSGTLSVLTNSASGSLGLASAWNVGGAPRSVVAADVNGDGRLDLVSANAGTNTLSVLTNTGASGFALASTPTLLGSPGSAAAADFNKDGRTELAVTYSRSGLGSWTNWLALLTNNGAGSFGLATGPVFSVTIFGTNVFTNLFPISVGGSCVVAAADVNRDSWPDLLCAASANNSVTVFTNNQHGGFGRAATLTTGDGPVALLAADVNGDSTVDVITANSSSGTLSVFTNNGSGGFALMASPAAGASPTAVAAGDINGDGRVDLVAANAGGTLTVLTNTGAGSFTVMATLQVGPSPTAVVAVDWNGDGRLELASADGGGNAVSVALWVPRCQLTGFAFAGDFSGSFSGNASGIFSGDGSGLDSLQATNIVNAGSGSGLDADLVDGQHASAFAPASGSAAYVAKSGDTMTGVLQVPANGLVAGGGQFVLASGNVGIGTFTPATRLDVAGVIQSAYGGFQFPDGTVQASAVPPTAAVPIGTVIDWWRPNTGFAVPDGYKICDGTAVADARSPLNGYAVPNLAGEFVLGVTDPAAIGSTGGSSTHSHGGSTSTDGAHSHSIQYNSWGVASGQNYMAYDVDYTSISGGHSHHVYTDTQPNYPPYVGLLKLMRIR